MGNMTKPEIDRIVKLMIKYKKKGQFRAYWANFNESVNLMASKEVVIESMWSPAVALLVAQGVNVRYAAPPEGFRGWCGSQGISANVKDPAKLQACYDYLNWMYDGFLGAAIMRQGYYIGNGGTLRNWIAKNGKTQPFAGQPFTVDEYDFWYGGKPASRDLPGHHGQGRRHQEGLRPRRRLLHEARVPLLLVELVLPRERLPGQAMERLPQRLSMNG